MLSEIADKKSVVIADGSPIPTFVGQCGAKNCAQCCAAGPGASARSALREQLPGGSTAPDEEGSNHVELDSVCQSASREYPSWVSTSPEEGGSPLAALGATYLLEQRLLLGIRSRHACEYVGLALRVWPQSKTPD